MDKPQKIQQTAAIKSTTMFLISKDIETATAKLVNERTRAMKSSLQMIESNDGLVSFIRNNDDAIELLITLLNIAEEKFKRIVSWVRISMGYTFDSEWTPSSMRGKLLENENLLRDFCKLFTDGYRLDKFRSIIPQFILEDFRIDKATIARLNNDDFIKSLIKKKVNTSYNTKYRSYYLDLVHEKVAALATKYGIEYLHHVELPFFDNTENIHALCYNGRKILIVSHYYLTTSSSQTTYAEKFISPLYQSLHGREEYILVNILDGAGWIGRSADFKKVYSDCHYFLNLKNLELLSKIIEYHFNISI